MFAFAVRVIAPEVDVMFPPTMSKLPAELPVVPAVTVTVPPVEPTFMLSKSMRPLPDIKRFPAEVTLPDGFTVVPPEIVKVVPAVRTPAPV